MLRILLVRAGTVAVTLLGVAVVVFVLVRVAPGNPVAMMLPPGATQEDIARLNALYGFDKSLSQQFVIWLGAVLRGDFGTSITMRQPVAGLVLGRLPATLELALLALIIALLVGGIAAIIGARYRGRVPELAVDLGVGVGLSVPDFLWGLGLILIFGVLWPVLYISGRVDPRLDIDLATNFYLFESLLRGQWSLTADLLAHSAMPALALGLPLAAIIAQLLKQSLNEELHLDYTQLARVRGLGETRVILSEALPNAALPTLTLVGVQLTFLIGGTVIIERLFAYEGLGNLAIEAVINRDLPLIQGVVLMFAVIFIAINLAVDLMYSFLNPRLRHG